MTDQQQIKNIIAFLSILFGESRLWYDEIMKIPPDYIIEKFNRYIELDKFGADWGLHPSLRTCVYEPYLIKWKIPHKQYIDVV